jgi:type IV secretion system protein VirB10
MRFLAIAGLLTASACPAQEPTPVLVQEQGAQEQAARQQTAQAQQQAPANANRMVMVPAGTQIELTLSSPIRTKSTKAGDTVRAVTAFPVTVNTKLAIPAGTYVQGTVEKVGKSGGPGHAGLQIRFIRMVFANGYSVPLDGATAEARADGMDATLPEDNDEGRVVPVSAQGFQQGFQQGPGMTPPPLPPLPGPHIGAAAGIAGGVAAAVIVTAILLHRRQGVETVLDAGTQLEMVLENPVSVDADRAAAAVAAPAAH